MDISNITISLEHLIWAAGAIMAFAGAYKILAPVLKLNTRVTNLEGRQSNMYEKFSDLKNSVDEMKEEIKIADRLIVKAMVEIIDNRITGNNVEGLRSTKSDLMAFLQMS